MVLGLAAYFLAVPVASPTVAELDELAKKRDIDALTRLLTPLPSGIHNPFTVLKTGGAYDVGRFGWHASEMPSADGKDAYIVIATPLTSEDVGEIVLRRSANRLTYIPETDAMGARIIHHRIDLRFDVPKKRAYLTDDATFDFEGSAPASVLIRMSPQYIVSKIADATGKPVAFQQAQGVVSIRRPSAKSATLTLTYDAEVNQPQYAGSISTAEATLVNDYWYPMIARMPSTYEISVHSPKGWPVAGQGEKLEERESDTERLTRYRMDLPVVFFSVIAAPFKVVSEKLGSRRYNIWSARMPEEQMRIQAELYQPIIEFYAHEFRDTPYPAFGAVDSKTYGGGALEAYTFATYGSGLPEEDAHEPAHTWWGGWINNTYLHSFWNESFAVYSDGLYHRYAPIGNPEERRLAFLSDESAEPDYAEAPLVDSGAEIGPAGSSLGYGKGAKVLQMMEEAFGKEPVVAAMRKWVTTHPKGQPGEWTDFERIYLEMNPTDRARGFIADWFRRPGFADFDADVSYADAAVNIHLRWKSLRFRMPLTVLLQKADGTRDYRTVWLDGQSDDIRLPFPEKPAIVSLDPHRQSVRVIASNERPTELDTAIGRMKKLVDPKHKDWLTNLGRAIDAPSGNLDPAGKFLVGSPETWSALQPLCEKAGFEVHGDRLTYKGTTIDLNHGAALAVIDLEGGKQCIVGLGKVRFGPTFGRTRLILTDDLGRLLRGVTDPKIAGKLTYRLP